MKHLHRDHDHDSTWGVFWSSPSLDSHMICE